MSFSNPYRHPTFERIKNTYRSLKEPHQTKINEFEQAKEAVWQESIEYKILNRIINLPTIPIPLVILFGGGLFLFLKGLDLSRRHDFTLLVILIVLLGYVLAPLVADALSNTLKNRVIRRNHQRLRSYEERANNSRQTIGMIDKSYYAEWASACVTFTGYPPDWSERCAWVKSRDGNRCTECGYPAGFRRKTRELQVHHIITISEGGTNELDNLITLCHICHRKIDSKHRGVRKINKLRTRRR